MRYFITFAMFILSRGRTLLLLLTSECTIFQTKKLQIKHATKCMNLYMFNSLVAFIYFIMHTSSFSDTAFCSFLLWIATSVCLFSRILFSPFTLACNKQCSFVELLSNALFSTLFLIQGESHLSVCLSVSKITQKLPSQAWWTGEANPDHFCFKFKNRSLALVEDFKKGHPAFILIILLIKILILEHIPF